MIQLREISKRFGHVQANDRVSLEVEPGTIHAIVGENGAGKSTAMRIAYGFYTPDSGEILVDGQPRRINSPRDAIALGIGMVHQHFMLVETMTVAENIVLGDEPGTAVTLDLREAAARIRTLSDKFKLAVDPATVIEQLSVGQQQRVELLKALYRNARLLILDEPTAVLTPHEVDELFGILREMRAQGRTIVIITHKLSEVLMISDAVTIMRDGRVVGRARTSETSASALAQLMVGREVLLRVDKPPASPGATMLAARDFSVMRQDGTRAVDRVSFDVRAGEIVGIAGVEGNGQTELIEALAGLVPPERMSGEVTLDGRTLAGLNARHRRERGIAHIPEDRHRRGLLLEFGLDENAILGVHHRPPITAYPGHVVMDEGAIRRRVNDIIRRFDVRPPDPTLPARALSGGNQQKLIIGRELLGTRESTQMSRGSGSQVTLGGGSERPDSRQLVDRPKLLLVSQPTRGVDIGAIEFIHRTLVALRDSGCAILLVSAELEEVMSLADRLLVIHSGRIAGEVDPTSATPEQLGLLMTQRRHA